MIQPSKRQGQIWQVALKSQGLSVIWESPDVNLSEMLNQLKEAGMRIPDLLLLDVSTPTLNPYAFCRWCREEHPGLLILLTNATQKEISQPERQWAIYQGAQDFLPGFQQETLLTGVTASVTRVLNLLQAAALNQENLIHVLFTLTSAMARRGANREEANETHPASSDTLSLEKQGDEPSPHLRYRGVPIAKPVSAPHPTDSSTDSQAPRRYRGVTY